MSDPIEYMAPWLVAKVDQRITFMVENGALDMARQAGAPFVMSFLDEGREDMTEEEREIWERTCDNCGRYIPPDADDGPDGFYTGHMARMVEGVQILMAFGVCGTCKAINPKGTEDV